MTGDIEIEILRQALTDKFVILPNELLRGAGVYSKLSMRARCLLGALLSVSNGWRTSRAGIDRWGGGLGSQGVSTALKELREGRFLFQRRRHDPQTGRFVWQWQVHLEPAPAGKGDGVSAGGTMPGLAGDGEPADGPPIPGPPTDGPPIHGEPGPHREVPEDLEVPEVQKDQEKTPPPTPRADAAAPSPVGAVTREGDQPEEDDSTDLPAEPGGLTAQARAALNAAVATVQACRPGWRQDEVTAAMRVEVDAGRDPLVVARAMRLVAEDRRSQGPGRLKTAGPWWGDPAPEEPVRVLDASVPRCRVFGHEGYPASNCAGCKAAARVREDTEPAGQVDPGARAAALALAAARSRPQVRARQQRAEMSA